MLDDESCDNNPQENSRGSMISNKGKNLKIDVGKLTIDEKPLTPTYLHESENLKKQKMPKADKPSTSVVYHQQHRNTQRGPVRNPKRSDASHRSATTRRNRIDSQGCSSDISGLLGNEATPTEGPSEAAIDAEEYIRNIWLDYEYEVNQIVSSLNEMNIYGQVKQYDPNDKIYQLAQKARTRASQPPMKREFQQTSTAPQLLGRQTHPSILSIDFEEYRDEVTDNLNPNLCHICHLDIGTKPKNCDFCCQICCANCIQAQRRFPKQVVLAVPSKDEPPRGQCCKTCVRRFFMFNFHKNHVNNPQTGIQSGEELIKNRYKDLQQKFQELQSVKKNIKKLAKEVSLQDAKFNLQQQRLQDKTRDWEETLQEVIERIEIKQKRLQNKKNEEIRLRKQKRQLNEQCDQMEFEINDAKRANEQQKNENKYLEELIKDARKQMRLQQREKEIKEWENNQAADVEYQVENISLPVISPQIEKKIKSPQIEVKKSRSDANVSRISEVIHNSSDQFAVESKETEPQMVISQQDLDISSARLKKKRKPGTSSIRKSQAEAQNENCCGPKKCTIF